ncbi:MAG: succinate semialdehyde dehydrogenase [Monoraphidium minutum]|nr:MAG: succinate semialdehyde dehydrogenase [Monoraphidium minutum]
MQGAVIAASLQAGLGSSAPILSCRLLSSVRRAFSSSGMALDRKQPPPPPLGVSEELAARISDKGLLKTHGLIGGDWMTAADGATYQVLNPATGWPLATLPRMRSDETLAAVAAAATVFPAWSALTAKQRGAVLRKWHQLTSEAAEDIALIMTAESGKPLAESRAEVAGGLDSIDWSASECRRVSGSVLETVSRDRRMLVLRQPVGVVGAVTPWNFPMSMITRKVAPALAAGCTVVLKPSEQTPLTALALAELAERAGVPDGAFNVVLGDPAAIGHALMSSEEVRKIGFTGSTAVGKMLMAQAANTVKRVSLELGGNAPFLVMADADLGLAAKGVVASALRNSGQTCICANRVFVHDKVYDEFAARVAKIVQGLHVGDGFAPATTHGPLINPAAVEKVVAHCADAVVKGAKVLAGGGPPEGLPEALKGGNFFAPTVLADATIDMRVFREETFGPLLPLFRFSTDDEAVALANDTEYGLAAYFYTRDLRRAWTLAERLEYGMIGVNEVAITSEVAPFGGVKQSGLGREQGTVGMEEFLEVKYVCMGLGYASPSDDDDD